MSQLNHKTSGGGTESYKSFPKISLPQIIKQRCLLYQECYKSFCSRSCGKVLVGYVNTYLEINLLENILAKNILIQESV